MTPSLHASLGFEGEHRRHSYPNLSNPSPLASCERDDAAQTLRKHQSGKLDQLTHILPEKVTDIAHNITIPPNERFSTPCLRGHYYPPREGTPLNAMVVIVPGTGQNTQTYARQAYSLSQHQPEGIGVVVCNKMGHGESEGFRGVFHEKEQVVGNVLLYLDAAREIADKTLAKNVPIQVLSSSSIPQNGSRSTLSQTLPSRTTTSQVIPLLIYGHSLGGMLAAYVLAEQGEALSQQWSQVHGVLHNPWLKLQDTKQPQPWQESVMDALVQFSQDAVICRSGSVWSTLYANLLASHTVPNEHSMIGVTAFKLAQNMGQALAQCTERIKHNITVVLSNEDDVVNPDFTESAFHRTPNAKIYRWHETVKADHNQNITPMGASAITDLVKGLLFNREKTPFMLEQRSRNAIPQSNDLPSNATKITKFVAPKGGLNDTSIATKHFVKPDNIWSLGMQFGKLLSFGLLVFTLTAVTEKIAKDLFS